MHTPNDATARRTRRGRRRCRRRCCVGRYQLTARGPSLHSLHVAALRAHRTARRLGDDGHSLCTHSSAADDAPDANDPRIRPTTPASDGPPHRRNTAPRPPRTPHPPLSPLHHIKPLRCALARRRFCFGRLGGFLRSFFLSFFGLGLGQSRGNSGVCRDLHEGNESRDRKKGGALTEPQKVPVDSVRVCREARQNYGPALGTPGVRLASACVG